MQRPWRRERLAALPQRCCPVLLDGVADCRRVRGRVDADAIGPGRRRVHIVANALLVDVVAGIGGAKVAEPVVKRGGQILSIWHSGEGQATRAVVKFPHGAAPLVSTLPPDESQAIPIGEALQRRKKRARSSGD